MAATTGKYPNTRHRVRLVWHRRDLRLHDNSLYCNLEEENVSVASIFVFDDKDFQPRPSICNPNEWNAVTVGPHATRILIESVQDLSESLQSIGGKLLIRKGSPVSIVPEMIQKINATEVFWNEEPGIFEQIQSKAVRDAIQERTPHVEIQISMQYTLYHPNDLPFGGVEWEQLAQPNKKRGKRKKGIPTPPVRRATPQGQVDINSERWIGMSKIMGDFRKAAREKTDPRACLPTPVRLQTPASLTHIFIGECPTLEELLEPLIQCTEKTILGLSHSTIQNNVSNVLKLQKSPDSYTHTGGEQAGLQHLSNFVANHAATAKRNLACVDNNQSAHISHLLSFGCLSPRRVVEEAKVHGDDCNWMISHLTMRDFFLYTCIASGHQFFQREGIPLSKKNSRSVVWKDLNDKEVEADWNKWATGKTGLPLIDAAMKELHFTGYCSNRVRQNLASVLTKDLGIDWRSGAELFQFLLGDHCVGANWGNWLYFSGVGPDPKQRHFRTVSQALKYDQDGSYVMKWLPEIANLKGEESFLRPWDFSDTWEPIVKPESQYTWQDLQQLQESGRLVAPGDIL